MKLEERLVIPIPKTYYTDMSPRARAAWKRRTVKNALYEIRNQIIDKTGEDIFQIFYMTDCIEVNIRGDLETRVLPKREAVRLRRKPKEPEDDW